jgi:hypothetical protein
MANDQPPSPTRPHVGGGFTLFDLLYLVATVAGLLGGGLAGWRWGLPIHLAAAVGLAVVGAAAGALCGLAVVLLILLAVVALALVAEEGPRGLVTFARTLLPGRRGGREGGK